MELCILEVPFILFKLKFICCNNSRNKNFVDDTDISLTLQVQT